MKIELTHDLIAKKVRDAVSAQDRARLHAQHIIRVRYELFVTMPQLLLTSDEIAFIQPHKADLLLSEDQMAFLAKSEKVIATELRWTYLRNFLNIAFFFGGYYFDVGTSRIPKSRARRRPKSGARHQPHRNQ
jgi:hypothetical protein